MAKHAVGLAHDAPLRVNINVSVRLIAGINQELENQQEWYKYKCVKGDLLDSDGFRQGMVMRKDQKEPFENDFFVGMINSSTQRKK